MSISNGKLKILMTGPNPAAPGGISTSVRCFLSFSQNSNFTIYHYLTGKPITQSDTIFKYLRRNLYQFYMFFIKLLGTNFSLVHIHTSSWGGFWRTSLYVLACKIRNIPVTLHVHGAEFKTFLLDNSFIKKRLILEILKVANGLIVLSSAWQKFFSFVVPNQNIFVLENMVDVPDTRVKYDNYKVINFLFLGGLTKRKGLQELVKVIPRFSNRKDINFTIAGFTVPSEKELRLKIEELANNPKTSKIVNFLPDISEKEKIDLLLSSHVYILQSFDEGLPFSLLEAMSYGLPTITTPVGAIPEFIEDYTNGFLIGPGDYNALESKINYFLSNHVTIEKMGKSNVNLIKDKFGLSRLKNKIEKIYIELSYDH
tara:strand:+ start:1972 stop:3081 length:1110 start_codon:yes stop_codon:yes gene_type:complete